MFYFIFIFRKNVAAKKIRFLQDFGKCPEGGFGNPFFNQLFRCKFSIFRQGRTFYLFIVNSVLFWNRDVIQSVRVVFMVIFEGGSGNRMMVD